MFFVVGFLLAGLISYAIAQRASVAASGRRFSLDLRASSRNFHDVFMSCVTLFLAFAIFLGVQSLLVELGWISPEWLHPSDRQQ